MVSYEVKELKDTAHNEPNTISARTNDLLLSEYMVKPMNKYDGKLNVDSLDGITYGGSSYGKSTKLFSKQNDNVFSSNQYDKDANK